LGQLLRDRFEIRKTLGSGGMGVVYEAFDHEQQRLVALKTLKKLSPKSLLLFKQEFRALTDLRHPNLIRLYELFSEGDLWFFTMELLSGRDFLSFVKEDNEISGTSDTMIVLPGDAETELEPEQESKELFFVSGVHLPRLRSALRQLIEALHALHRFGKVHRDIKPSNVMITDEGRLVLMDFGLVAEEGADNQLVIGTPYFMAPEQAAGHPVTAAADWYSVGVMLFLTLTGRLPFSGSSVQVIMDKQQKTAPLPSTFNDLIPPELEAVCSSLLRRRPESRPDAAQILFMLGEENSIEKSGLSAPFIGREKELATLYRFFEESRQRPTFVVIYGESGVGKSAFLRRFFEELPSRVGYFGLLILRGRCYEREQVPYKAFDGIIDLLSSWLLQRTERHLQKLLPPQAHLMGRLFPVLRQIQGLEEDPEDDIKDPREARRLAFRVIRQLFQSISQRIQPILWIDDIQWADGDSIALLEDLLSPEDDFPLLVVATQHVNHSIRWRLLPESIWLGELSSEESSRLLREAMDSQLSETESTRLLSEAKGHPLLLLELIRAARQSVTTTSIKLDEVLQTRIQQQAKNARRIVELSAIAGRPLSLPVFSDALAILPGVIRAELFELHVGCLMKSTNEQLWETYHDRVREAVLAYLSAQEARAYHLCLAQVLERETQKDSQALMRHFESGGDLERAAYYAILSAQRAEEALAFEQSVIFLRAAIRLRPNEKNQDLYFQLGDSLAQIGRGPDAADAFLHASIDASPQRQLECKSRAVEHLLGSGHVERGKFILSSVLSSIREEWPETTAHVLTSLLWNRARMKVPALSIFSKRRPLQEELLRLDIYHYVSLGLGPVDGLLAAYFQSKGLRLALQVKEPLRLGRALVMEAIFVALEGNHRQSEAHEMLSQAKKIATEQDDQFLLCLVECGLGVSHSAAGRFRDAAQLLSTVEHRYFSLGRPPTWELNNVRIFRILALRQMGLWEDIRFDLSLYLQDAESRENRLTPATLIRTVAQSLLTQDEPEKALASIEQYKWPNTSSTYHAQQFNELLARVDVCLYQELSAEQYHTLHAEFERLWASMLLRMQIMRTEACWARARFSLAAAISTNDPRIKHQALSEAEWLMIQLSNERVPYAEIWYRLLAASLSLVNHKTQTALEHLRQAESLAIQQDLPLCAMVACYRLAALLGDSERAQRAAQWFLQQGIVSPARFVNVFIPSVC
jgi:serine/threonine protein kinase/tetratricopeptide (TPR) repeat protein